MGYEERCNVTYESWAPNPQATAMYPPSGAPNVNISDPNIITSEPGAAWYIFLDFVEYKDKLLERDIKNSAELCERLINEIGLVTVPGSSFGYNGLTLRYSFVDINKDLTNLEKYDLENIMKPELINSIRKGIDCLEYWLR